MFEMVNSRKFGTRSELNVSLQRGRTVVTWIGSVGGYAEEVVGEVTGSFTEAGGVLSVKRYAPCFILGVN
jgi:hypothetical protein